MERGGDLASIADKEEEEFIEAEVISEADNYWLGLDDQSVEGQFEWVDRIPVLYTKWSNLEPDDGTMKTGSLNHDEDCTIIKPGMEWSDVRCWNEYKYICKNSNDKTSHKPLYEEELNKLNEHVQAPDIPNTAHLPSASVANNVLSTSSRSSTNVNNDIGSENKNLQNKSIGRFTDVPLKESVGMNNTENLRDIETELGKKSNSRDLSPALSHFKEVHAGGNGGPSTQIIKQAFNLQQEKAVSSDRITPDRKDGLLGSGQEVDFVSLQSKALGDTGYTTNNLLTNINNLNSPFGPNVTTSSDDGNSPKLLNFLANPHFNLAKSIAEKIAPDIVKDYSAKFYPDILLVQNICGKTCGDAAAQMKLGNAKELGDVCGRSCANSLLSMNPMEFMTVIGKIRDGEKSKDDEKFKNARQLAIDAVNKILAPLVGTKKPLSVQNFNSETNEKPSRKPEEEVVAQNEPQKQEPKKEGQTNLVEQPEHVMMSFPGEYPFIHGTSYYEHGYTIPDAVSPVTVDNTYTYPISLPVPSIVPSSASDSIDNSSVHKQPSVSQNIPDSAPMPLEYGKNKQTSDDKNYKDEFLKADSSAADAGKKDTYKGEDDEMFTISMRKKKKHSRGRRLRKQEEWKDHDHQNTHPFEDENNSVPSITEGDNLKAFETLAKEMKNFVHEKHIKTKSKNKNKDDEDLEDFIKNKLSEGEDVVDVIGHAAAKFQNSNGKKSHHSKKKSYGKDLKQYKIKKLKWLRNKVTEYKDYLQELAANFQPDNAHDAITSSRSFNLPDQGPDENEITEHVQYATQNDNFDHKTAADILANDETKESSDNGQTANEVIEEASEENLKDKDERSRIEQLDTDLQDIIDEKPLRHSGTPFKKNVKDRTEFKSVDGMGFEDYLKGSGRDIFSTILLDNTT
ncbi:uncharacterized protein LOC130628852 [Hydractinia symbiolongicarpus]|uniref:uncharacterized protein LOC130628852 n=1 Tax=Hydractinia symbiolongicarpus TaxID=13093 RepID=UPI00254C3A77|nr:uncharacterized protein LOC130628852 [Hydractinia symbiolongicarpus]